MSWSSRTPASVRNAAACVIASIVTVFALTFAARTLDRPQGGRSVDSFHSMAALPALRSTAPQRVAFESSLPSRPSSRSPHGVAAALPVFAQRTLVSDAAHSEIAAVSAGVSASIVDRGYDATAPPR
jgi:hypothetical protein